MPISIYVRQSEGLYNLFWLDLPFFLSATWSVCVFYHHSQKEIYPDWTSRFQYIFFSLALGIGLCVNNTKAVFEGLFSETGEFTRTPKFAVVRKGDSWKDKSYRGRINAASIVEVLLTFNFLAALGYALVEGIYFSIPFLLMFEIGFFYTSALSFLQSRFVSPLVDAPQVAPLFE